MKKFLLFSLLLFFSAVNSFAGFIIHSYYHKAINPDCHEIFVVVTFDNGDGEGEIYISSGMVQVGSGCPGMVVSDPNVIMDLAELLATPEVNAPFQTYLNSKGIDGSDLAVTSQISVFCNPELGFVIVSRLPNVVDNVEIRSLQGTLLKSFNANLNLKTERYDISDLQPGIYIVAVGKDHITIRTDQVAKQ